DCLGGRWQREAALLTSACRPATAYSRVGTDRTPSAVPSSSNFPASHLGSELGLIVQSYRAFSSPPLGRPTRLSRQAIFRRRRHQPRRPPPAKISPGSPAPAMGPGTAAGGSGTLLHVVHALPANSAAELAVAMVLPSDWTKLAKT